MTQDLLSERSQQLLGTLIRKYIRDGQPVGSRVLAQDSGLALSSASIRNVMADLEAHGYIASPHTSAGRVPTARGYRFFVDTLLTMNPVFDQYAETLSSTLDPDLSPVELIEATSGLLSLTTCQAGVVTLFKHDTVKLRQVEFLSLSEDRVLAILVVDEQEVQNRIIHTGRRFPQHLLTQAANYINQRFTGLALAQIKEALLSDMAADEGGVDRIIAATLEVTGQAFDLKAEDDCVIVGQGQLLESTQPEQINQLRELFAALEHKRDILHLLESCVDANGVQIFIGAESGYQVLGDYSVVTSPYHADGQTVGVLGVIGPTRMSYERVIPIVDITARMLGVVLDHKRLECG